MDESNAPQNPPPPPPPPNCPPNYPPPAATPYYSGPLLPPPPPPPRRKVSVFVWILGFMAVGGFAFFVLIFALAFVSVPPPGGFMEEHIQGSGSDKIAVIEVKGVIGDFASLFGSSNMVDKTVKMIRHAADDSAVKAVLLSVDSPGGGVTASDVICNEIKKLKEKKPVVVHMGDLCASGGVYISAPANVLVASPTSITGSIGVIISHTDMTELYNEKLGMKDEPIKSGIHKDILSTGRAMTPEERQLIQGLVDEMYERFLTVVAEGRAGKGPVPAKVEDAKEYIRKFADGRIFSGEAAVANGLVDKVGYFEDAVKEAEKAAGISSAEVFRYRQPGGLLAALSEGSFGGGAQRALTQAELQAQQAPRLEYRFDLPRPLPLQSLLPLLKE
jgi:protease IV